jgi:photosystem II stability/assembly factor-like uncharacterized protein
MVAAAVVSLAGCTSSPSPSPSATASPTPTPVPAPRSASDGLANLSADEAVESAGTFGKVGIWAIRSSTLFISTDAGDTWHDVALPARNAFLTQGTTQFLDEAHAWTVSLGPGSTDFTGSTDDIARYVVDRTSDGGRTWKAADVPGNYAGTSASIGFVDDQHGYLLAAAQRHSSGRSTVLRTDDGGAMWSVAGAGPWLGSLLAVSDATTIWAAGQEQAGGEFAQPILAVSRDGGRTFEDVTLPGVQGTTEAQCDCYMPEPPVLVDPSTGYLVVVTLASTPMESRLYRTTDAGLTWTSIADRTDVEASGLAVLDSTHLLLARVNPTSVDLSADGGSTWSTASAGGAWDDTYPLWIGGLPPDIAASLVSLPQTDGRLFGLIRTLDGGRTWQQLRPG